MNQINVTRSSLPPFEEYCTEIKGLWDSRWLTNMGEKHKKLEEALKGYLNAPNITLYTNGHLALEHIITAMGFPEGGEVITTPFTFASTTHAIVRCGLTPVFCDVNPVDYTIDVSKMTQLITEKTVAILPVHVYGNLCDVEGIDIVAKKHNLKVLYDAAHTFGVKKNGVSTANFGDAAMFSFHATKVFHTIEGGGVTFSDQSLSAKLDSLKNFGMTSATEVPFVGGNAKMSEFQAAMGLCNLRYLDENLCKREVVVKRYRAHFSGVDGIQICPPQKGVSSNYAYFPVVFRSVQRDRVCLALEDQNIIARKYFYPLTNDFICYSEHSFKGDTPIARGISEKVLTLPLYPDLPLEIVEQICHIILSVV